MKHLGAVIAVVLTFLVVMGVGSGQLTLQAFEDAFRAADGMPLAQTAPARGLCLTMVTYEVGGETPAGVNE